MQTGLFELMNQLFNSVNVTLTLDIMIDAGDLLSVCIFEVCMVVTVG